jgi:hypothetical protein
MIDNVKSVLNSLSTMQAGAKTENDPLANFKDIINNKLKSLPVTDIPGVYRGNSDLLTSLNFTQNNFRIV